MMQKLAQVIWWTSIDFIPVIIFKCFFSCKHYNFVTRWFLKCKFPYRNRISRIKIPHFYNFKCISNLFFLGLLPFSQLYGEKNFGLASIFMVNCLFCVAQNKISSSKSHKTYHRGPQAFDVNTSAVLGALHAGVGHTHLSAIT